MPNFKIAGIVFCAEGISDYTVNQCKEYLYSGTKKPDFALRIDEKDIQKEYNLAPSMPYCALESIALYRKLIEKAVLSYSGTVIHGSAVAVDGNGYLFTAPSGTGKSTHTRLYREYFGERAQMINDDKPIVKLENGSFYIYGTPWEGKEKLGNNVRVPLKGICFLERGKNNSIKKITPKEGALRILKQTIRPETEETADKLFGLIDKLLNSVNLYELKCNMDISAVETSFGEMSK